MVGASGEASVGLPALLGDLLECQWLLDLWDPSLTSLCDLL